MSVNLPPGAPPPPPVAPEAPSPAADATMRLSQMRLSQFAGKPLDEMRAPGGESGSQDSLPHVTVDVETMSYMALKRLAIEHGVPKKRASEKPGKAYLKELCIEYGCNITFAS